MTIGGWITFLLVTGSVIIFFFYSMYRVLSVNKKRKIHNLYDTNED